jgi:hypothetical protein
VTVDEILTMVNIALGNAVVSTCTVGDANDDQQITVDEILTAVDAALNGCPSSPAASPLGPIQVTSLVFSNVLPLVGIGTHPSIDTFVTAAVTQGLDPVLNQLVAVDPTTREKIPNGVRLDFGSGTPQPLGTLAGQITATYSNVTQAGNTISFDGAIHTESLTLNGAGLPITDVNVSVNATQTDGGKSTMNITLSGSGASPPSTVSGNAVMDTARCPNYPVGGAITATIGGTTATIHFNDSCNGTFGFSGGAAVNFLVTYFNCYRDDWYSWTQFLVAENGHLGDDLSDDEPPNLTVSGTLSDTDVNMSWETKCRTATCDPTQRWDGTFIGHFWKEEQESFDLVRYYIGTYTSHYVKYNGDGTVYCEATRVLNEQDGMNDYYHFLKILPSH